MKIQETISNPLTNGIFIKLHELYSDFFTWLTNDVASTLNMNYYLNHSGEKTITPMYVSLLKMEEDGKIGDVLTFLAQSIKTLYGDNWNKIYDAYVNTSYNPLNNYDMVENEKIGSKVTNTRDAESNTYGFNSTTPVPTDTGKETYVTSGDMDDNKRELTRSGNIGVTSSQQLLQSEIDLRKYIFYDTIMLDIDKVLALSIYE